MKGETITNIDDYMPAKTDKVLPVIKSVKASNQATSVDDLFREHHKMVYLAAYRISGKAQDAEDVLQTVFLRLLKRAEPFIDIGDEPRRYLCRAAINASFDISRSKKNRPLVSLDEKQHKLEMSEALSTQDNSVDKELRQAEQQKQLRAALLQLNSRAAEIFVLRYFEEFNNAEIAEFMQTSATSIGVELHRTRARLRELLSEFED
jgi:RNA polymerase sigma-70 factor (ECF subfamily)